MTHPGYGTAGEPQQDEASSPQQKGGDRSRVVFSFFVRQRLREAMQETHGLVSQRVRSATDAGNQGHAASETGLIAEIKVLSEAKRYAATQHGPRRIASMVYVRHAYLEIAASTIILGERVTRPEEAPRRAGAKDRQVSTEAARPTEKWRPLSLSVPA